MVELPENFEEIVRVMQMDQRGQHMDGTGLSFPLWAELDGDDAEGEDVSAEVLQAAVAAAHQLDLQLAQITQAYLDSRRRNNTM